MTVDQKVRQTLAELGVTESAGVVALFAEVCETMERERRELVNRVAADKAERDRACKELRDRWLARKNGLLSLVDERWLKKAPRELKPVVGQHFNALRKASEQLEVGVLAREMKCRVAASAGAVLEARSPIVAGTTVLSGVSPDLTLPSIRRPLGSMHPVTRVLREIEEIFIALGFRIETGPEIETVEYNFDALNIPETHPSRDDWDTLYVDEKTVLRTHTSPVQIRAMRKYGAPLYVIAPGKVYRHDKPDSSHATMFHQVEGLAVDRDITFADLKGTLDYFAKRFFGEKVRTSFHPSFFPFTEPSGEVAISCTLCDGRGCRVCKESGWLEVMGCGMVHPEVLRQGGIEPEEFTGWAFGMGVERYAMMKYGIDDIQLFFQNDVRFLKQF